MPCNLKSVMDTILNVMRCHCKKKAPTHPNKQLDSSSDDESQSLSTSDFDFINSLRKFNFELYEIVSSSNGSDLKRFYFLKLTKCKLRIPCDLPISFF